MSIFAHCDNERVIEILKHRSCKDIEVMHLPRLFLHLYLHQLENPEYVSLLSRSTIH